MATVDALTHTELAQQTLARYPGESFEVVVIFDPSRYKRESDPVYMQLCNLGRPSAEQLRLAMRHMMINVGKNPWLGFSFTRTNPTNPVKRCVGYADMGCPSPFALWNAFNDRFGVNGLFTDRWVVRINEGEEATIGQKTFMYGASVQMRCMYSEPVYTLPVRLSSI